MKGLFRAFLNVVESACENVFSLVGVVVELVRVCFVGKDSYLASVFDCDNIASDEIPAKLCYGH